MIQPEELVGEEWAAWYRLSPAERWTESEQLWQIYFRLGGSLETEFFDPREPRARTADGRPGMRVLRRSRV